MFLFFNGNGREEDLGDRGSWEEGTERRKGTENCGQDVIDAKH